MSVAGILQGSTPWVEALGYVAAGLVIVTYSMKTMIPLRATSLCASVLFITYGFLAPSYPQIVLHGTLLPLNAIRLRQMINLVEQVKASWNDDLSMEWLGTYGARRRCRAGDILFRKGDPADTMFYTVSGRYVLEEIGVEIGPGEVIGEIGMVTPDNQRTQTFKCIEAGDLLGISYERVKELYFQNPRFGFYFLNLVARRLIANTAHLEKLLEQDRQKAPPRQKSAPARSRRKAAGRHSP